MGTYTYANGQEKMEEALRARMGCCREKEGYGTSEIFDRIIGRDGVFEDLIDDTLAGHGERTGEAFINTFPFGIKSNEVFPQFLAIYKEENRDTKWADVLGAVMAYLEREVSRQYELREVFILTDSWNKRMQKKFEDKLLERYFNGGVRIYVYLYTDCGYTNIPLITNSEWIGEPPRRMTDCELLERFRHSVIHFQENSYESFSRENNYSEIYDICIGRDWSAKIHRMGYGEEAGQVYHAGKKETKQFLLKVWRLSDHFDEMHMDGFWASGGIEFDIEVLGRDIHLHNRSVQYQKIGYKLINVFRDYIESAKNGKE